MEAVCLALIFLSIHLQVQPGESDSESGDTESGVLHGLLVLSSPPKDL